MRGDVTVYSPKNVLCTMGIHIASGFTEDGFITITPQGDGVTDEAGADGEVVISIPDDPRYEIKLVLQYGSKTNNWLLKKYNNNKQTRAAAFSICKSKIWALTRILRRPRHGFPSLPRALTVRPARIRSGRCELLARWNRRTERRKPDMKMKRMEMRDITVGEYQFKIRPFGAKDATYIFGDVASIILPILGTVSVASNDKMPFTWKCLTGWTWTRIRWSRRLAALMEEH